jgi:hypothetical protein
MGLQAFSARVDNSERAFFKPARDEALAMSPANHSRHAVRIAQIAGTMGHPDVPVRWIEAWMRVRFGELTPLSEWAFRTAVQAALQSVYISTDEENEALAREMGL